MKNSKYDVIVIGAGPAGLTWVDEALKNKNKVLLIDQGEFEEANYSSIGASWTSGPKVKLGGIGGTANAWQGQCVPLDPKQFSEIFNIQSLEEYNDYLEVSKELATKLSIKFDHRIKRLQARAKHELQLPSCVNVKFSYMPVVQNWNQIFKFALKSELLEILTTHVQSIEFQDNFVCSIILSNKQQIQFDRATKLVLATNSIATAQLLPSADNSDAEFFTSGKVSVYDHPWRTKYRYDSKGNKFAKRKIFSYHLGINCRMKTKYKFEVAIDASAIGVFELRPEFRGSLISKIVARGSQKILGYSLIKPSYVDVWCQIAQSVPILYPNSGTMEGSLDDEDYKKLVLLEEFSKNILVKSGFVLLDNHVSNNVNQAFHTTGTLDFYSKNSKSKLEYPGVSREFKNLYVSGGAGLGNCSWVNPTFTIMVLALLNAKKAFKTL